MRHLSSQQLQLIIARDAPHTIIGDSEVRPTEFVRFVLSCQCHVPLIYVLHAKVDSTGSSNGTLFLEKAIDDPGRCFPRACPWAYSRGITTVLFNSSRTSRWALRENK